MKKLNLEDISKYLIDNGFRRLSLDGHNKQTYINEDNTLTIIIEENIDDITPEDEERIKKRLIELGYL